MNNVFLLWHTHVLDDGEEDSKLLGVYSSESMAKGKIKFYKDLSGFRDHLDGFEITRQEVDVDWWKEGFVTL